MTKINQHEPLALRKQWLTELEIPKPKLYNRISVKESDSRLNRHNFDCISSTVTDCLVSASLFTVSLYLELVVYWRYKILLQRVRMPWSYFISSVTCFTGTKPRSRNIIFFVVRAVGHVVLVCTQQLSCFWVRSRNRIEWGCSRIIYISFGDPKDPPRTLKQYDKISENVDFSEKSKFS